MVSFRFVSYHVVYQIGAHLISQIHIINLRIDILNFTCNFIFNSNLYSEWESSYKEDVIRILNYLGLVVRLTLEDRQGVLNLICDFFYLQKGAF